MAEAFRGNIICPNKEKEADASFHKGHLLESETYVGGRVESLETGIFRSDLPYKFELVPSALQGLIDAVDRDLTFAIEARPPHVARCSSLAHDLVRGMAG